MTSNRTALRLPSYQMPQHLRDLIHSLSIEDLRKLQSDLNLEIYRAVTRGLAECSDGEIVTDERKAA